VVSTVFLAANGRCSTAVPGSTATCTQFPRSTYPVNPPIRSS